MEDRILIHAPTGKDARLIAQVLSRAAIDSFICTRAEDVAIELLKGAGGLFIVDEALKEELLVALDRFLRNQPTWSDLPLLVLSQRRLDEPDMQKHYLRLGNVTLLERPVQSVTLVSAATSALRGRKRQYAMREIDRRKDEFLAMLAHELRNPLAPVSAASELLKIPTLDPARIRQTSDIISRQVKHMTGLIDDLLDVSRVSRGLVTLDEEMLDARQIVGNAVEQARPLIDARRHRLTLHICAAPAHIQGDQKRLVQILANILNNAAKYTPEGGDIDLHMDVNDGDVVFHVSDNGIGMAPRVITHIFEMFAQAERTSDRSQGGLGIGLALVKNLVNLHRGSVSAHSAGPGQGSRFSITLPRVQPSQAMAGAAAAGSTPVVAKRNSLLIVDDNVDAAEILGLLLETAGYRIAIAHSAKAAIAAAQAEPPDAYLLDIGLPDMDGSALAAHLRAQPASATATLIAITGYGQDVDRKKTADAGFDHHFVKPVDIEQLLLVLSQMR